jgi:hypothetical protein
LRAFAGSVGRLGVLSKPQFGRRTKTEHLATILLPDPVAAHDTRREVVDGDAEILKENKTEQNGSSLAEMAATEFRVRCIRPLSILETPARTKSSGARHLLGRRSPVGEAAFVFMADYAKIDIPYR